MRCSCRVHRLCPHRHCLQQAGEAREHTPEDVKKPAQAETNAKACAVLKVSKCHWGKHFRYAGRLAGRALVAVPTAREVARE